MKWGRLAAENAAEIVLALAATRDGYRRAYDANAGPGEASPVTVLRERIAEAAQRLADREIDDPTIWEREEWVDACETIAFQLMHPVSAAKLGRRPPR